MSSAFGIIILVALAISFPCVEGGFWSWARGWSEEEPANCPSRNNVTHVCSSIESSNGTCFTIKCCDDFSYDESFESISDSSYESYEESSHGRSCRLCYSSRTCALYKCYRSCCEGYERDAWGRCSNKTGELQCENGGVLRHTWWGVPFCKCPSGFRGHNCEIPKCRCKNGGDCIVKDGRPFCNCTEGYYGDRCEKSNCTLKCYNGGWCYRYGSNEFCWCPRRFIGDQCQQHYKNPDTCPLPKEDDGTCQCQCSRNSHCKEDEVCCKEGCSSFCRKKKQDFCEYEGKTYAINSTYSPSPCTNCTCDANAEMVCYSISCAIPRCLYGKPETLPGQCCPSCPDKPDPPTISNCPTSVLSVDVSIDSESAILRKSITTINAYDTDGNKLKVKYQPRKVYHCQCWSPKPISVQAYTEDDLGGTASCSFNVTVKDPYPPRFYNCPKDIHVVENTTVRWNEPSYEDNVGIGRFIGPGLSGSIFPVGSHNMTYQVWDFDGNTASCVFSIYVVQRGPPKLYHCPADVIRLNTSLNTNFAVIKDTAIGLQAYDIDGNKLHVTYQPQTIDHCKCSDSHKANFEVSAMAVDDYGKVARCNFTVTVRDIFPPKVSFCPDDISVLEGDVVTWKDPVFVDNVGIAQNYVNMEKGTSYPVGRHTVVYTVKDYDRNEASCSFEIIVDKAKPDPPKIHNCPVNVVQLNTSYMSDYAIVNNRNTVTSGILAFDADGNYLQVKYSPEKVYHCKCSSYNTVTYTIFAEVVDSHGNKDTCQFNVVVKDIYKPVFTSCPSHIYVSENEQVTWQEPTYYDNVGVLDMSRSGYESGQVPPVGNHTVYYKVWDFQYNTAVCKFNITVTKEPPKPPKILNCPIKVLSLNTAFNSNEAKLSENVTAIQAYDNAGKKLQVNYQPAAVRHCYCFNTHTTETTVIAWAVDDAGVKETCEFNVTVSDKQAPVITKCPGDIERYEGETIDDVRRQPVEFQDNVKVANDYWSIQNIDTFTPGKHNVSFEIWDYDYNNARCNFTVTVTRRKVPKIKNCPPNDLFLSAPSNGNSVMLSESTTSIEAYDGDGNKLMVNYKPASVRHCFCGIPTSNYTRVEASATDSAGNAVSCSFRAFVLDEVTPVFTYCPWNMYVRENTVVSWREPVYHDNVAVVNKSISGWKRDTVFPVGRHTIVYEIWDFDGNSATCQFSVVVKHECTLECQNGGRCYRQGNDQLCICTPDYIGTHCENKYTHPSTCPVPEISNRTCSVRCDSNIECSGNSVCCKEGCSTVCRQPKTVYCKFEDQQYRVNETYSPEPCTTCVCHQSGEMRCVIKCCAMPECAGGRQPVSRPDQCCLVCPEVPQPRIYCPPHVVHVNTSYYTNMTLLDDTKTSVAAFNHFGLNLQVNYRPAFVHHCECDKPLDHVTSVEAYASDHYGNVATCSFQVVVRDIYAPVIFSCPEDVYVFENEAVKWLEPNAADNVGVASKTCTSLRNGTRFPVGDHRITCNIHDFDGNMASCNFRVSVTRKDTPFEDMPVGLRERSTGEPEVKLSVILPPIFGAIVLVVLALLLLFLCRRKCLPVISKKKPTKHPKTDNIYAEPDDIRSTKSSLKSKRSSVSTYSSSVSSRSSAGRALAFHSNAHAVPGDIGIRPPPYSPYVGYNPPPYSVSGSVKDVMYMSMPVPAYHNPDYESLSVHMPSNSGRSVRSGSRSSRAGSTKSSRSSKSGSIKSTKSSSRA